MCLCDCRTLGGCLDESHCYTLEVSFYSYTANTTGQATPYTEDGCILLVSHLTPWPSSLTRCCLQAMRLISSHLISSLPISSHLVPSRAITSHLFPSQAMHLISSRLISSRPVSCHHISSDLISSRLVPSHLISSHLISSISISGHLIPSHPIPSHLTAYCV